MMKKLLKGDQEAVKEIKELKNLTPNEILTRLPVLLVHIKPVNNSQKLKSNHYQKVTKKK